MNDMSLPANYITEFLSCYYILQLGEMDYS